MVKQIDYLFLKATSIGLVLLYLGALCWAMTPDDVAPKGKEAALIAEYLK